MFKKVSGGSFLAGTLIFLINFDFWRVGSKKTVLILNLSKNFYSGGPKIKNNEKKPPSLTQKYFKHFL